LKQIGNQRTWSLKTYLENHEVDEELTGYKLYVFSPHSAARRGNKMKR